MLICQPDKNMTNVGLALTVNMIKQTCFAADFGIKKPARELALGANRVFRRSLGQEQD